MGNGELLPALGHTEAGSSWSHPNGGVVEWGAGLWVAGRSWGLECRFAFSQKHLNNEKERKMFSENPLRLKAGLGWRGRGDSTRGQKRYSSEHRRKREGLSLLCAMCGAC